MRYSTEELEAIYTKTGGYCRYCGKKLAWSNYGQVGERAAWVVEHSVPLSRGGTDYFRNKWPACVECNLQKGTLTGPEFLRKVQPSGSGGSLLDALVGIALVFVGAAFLGALLRAWSRDGDGWS